MLKVKVRLPSCGSCKKIIRDNKYSWHIERNRHVYKCKKCQDK